MVTDWGGTFALDVIVLPSVDLVREVSRRGLAILDGVVSTVEILVDDQDTYMASLLTDAGFALRPGQDATAWMSAAARPDVSSLSTGYSLASRAELPDSPHHMVGRNGAQVAERLGQTSRYRKDLDLVIVDATGEPVAYGLFWYDPSTNVGLVEPMRTEESHQRRGLARHILTSGINRLVDAGATRIKIAYQQGNPASRSLYLGVVYVPESTTSLYVLQRQES